MWVLSVEPHHNLRSMLSSGDMGRPLPGSHYSSPWPPHTAHRCLYEADKARNSSPHGNVPAEDPFMLGSTWALAKTSCYCSAPLREVTAGRPLGGLTGRGAAPGAGVNRCLLDERAHEGRDARAHSVLAQSLVGTQKWQP